MRYNGPSNAILSLEEDCLYAVDIKSPSFRDLIVSPFSTCRPGLSFRKEAKYFKVEECKPTRSDDYREFVQVKTYNGQYFIYCPGSTYTLGNRDPTLCPNDVFTLPLTATFTINDVEYKGAVLDLVYKEKLDPMFMEKANWHLKPSINWTDLIKDLDEQHYHHRSRHAPGALGTPWIILIIFGCGGLVAALCVAACLVFKYRVVITDTRMADAAPLNSVKEAEADGTEDEGECVA